MPHVHTASRSTEAALVSRAHAAVAATRDAAVDLLSARAEDADTDAASRAVHAQTAGRAAVNGLVERRCGAAGGCTRALAEAARRGLDVHQFTPARIKRCVAGHGAARKESVASMLGQMIPELAGAGRAGLPADATDAVAVAWTRFEELRSPLLGGGSPAAGRGRGRSSRA